jgi:hypothetical protein
MQIHFDFRLDGNADQLRRPFSIIPAVGWHTRRGEHTPILSEDILTYGEADHVISSMIADLERLRKKAKRHFERGPGKRSLIRA